MQISIRNADLMGNVHIEIYDSTSFCCCYYPLSFSPPSPVLFSSAFELYLNEIPKRAVDFYCLALSFGRVPAFTFNK